MTEFGMGLSQPYDISERVKSSVGTPMSSVRARVVADGQNYEFANNKMPNIDGDLEILSPGLFNSYWKLPEKTAEEFTGYLF